MTRKAFTAGLALVLALVLASSAAAGAVCTLIVEATCNTITLTFLELSGENQTQAKIFVDGELHTFAFDGSHGTFTTAWPTGGTLRVDLVVKVRVRYEEEIHRTTIRRSVPRGFCEPAPSPTPPPTVPPKHDPAPPPPAPPLAFTGGGPNPFVAYPAVAAGALSALALGALGIRAIRRRRT